MSEDTSAFSNTRRRFLATTGAAGAFALAGCVGGDDDDGDDDPNGDDAPANGDDAPENGDDGNGAAEPDEVDFVLNPAEETVEITVQYQPLFDYLEEQLDIEINPIPAASYPATVEELVAAGEGDAVFADTSPGAIIQEPDEVDVVGIREAFGSELYFGMLATTPDSGIEEIADLEGEQVATASATSVSGGYVPLLLLQEGGLDIGNAAQGGDPEDFEWLPSDHVTAREQLEEDPSVVAAGAGEFQLAPQIPPEQIDEVEPRFADISPDYPEDGHDEPELQLLAVSDPIPRAPIVVNAQWEDSLREEVEQALYEFGADDIVFDPFFVAEEVGLNLPDELLEEYDEEGGVDADDWDLDEAQRDDLSILEDHELWFTGVAEADADDFTPIEELMADLGVAPEEF